MSNPSRDLTSVVAVRPIEYSTTLMSSLSPWPDSHGNLLPMWGTWLFAGFRDDPGLPPVHFQHSFHSGAVRLGGYLRMGESPQTPHEKLDITARQCPPGTPLAYAEIPGDPEGHTDDIITYEARNDDPLVLYRFSSRSARFVDGSNADLTFEYLPGAVMVDDNSPLHFPQLNQQCFIHGTLDGKHVEGFGGIDRVYGTRKQFDNMMNLPWFVLNMGGLRQDGNREWCQVVIAAEEGTSYAYYASDTEDLTISTDLDYELEWEELGYSDPGTTVLMKARVTFAGRIVNYTAKWGFRGHRDEYLVPVSKEPGMTHGSGTWHCGDEPYQHVNSAVFYEAHQIFDGRI